MALATQCPHCQTTFRVAQDQLKLRAGLVRCGHCKEIFNGIEHLLPPSNASASSNAAPVPTAPPPNPPTPSNVTSTASAVIDPSSVEPQQQPTFDQQHDDHEPVAEQYSTAVEPPETVSPSHAAAPSVTHIDFDIPANESDHDVESHTDHLPTAATIETTSTESTDPLQRMTLLDFTQELPDSIDLPKSEASEQHVSTETFAERELSNAEEISTAPPERDELDEAIEDLQRKPWRGTKKKARLKEDVEPDPLDEADSDEDEPGFLKRERRNQKYGRKLRLIFGIGSALLLIAALLQGTYIFRNQLAGVFPQTKPMLAQMCNLLGCHIDLPAQIASVSIESSELQTVASAKDRFVLTTLLRNYSSTAQEWPYIELTLNDGNEKALLKRVFKPADYVKQTEIRTGFPSDSERTVKVSFELSQVQASGYRVYLFYP